MTVTCTIAPPTTGDRFADSLTPSEAEDCIDIDLIHRFTRGDCGVLAHHLATMNRWGVCIVGSLDHRMSDDDPDLFMSGVESLVHAWAIRPDGMLVDVTGVHHPAVADDIAQDWALDGVERFDYPDAASADALWNHAQWLGTPWEDDYAIFESVDVARLTAALVTRAYATA